MISICITHTHTHTRTHARTLMQVKRILLVADIGVSGFNTFMWFVTFCFTANERRKVDIVGSPSYSNCMNSVVAFSFFSIIFWVSIADGFRVNWGSRFTGPFLDSPNHSRSSAYEIVWLFGPVFRFIEPKCTYPCRFVRAFMSNSYKNHQPAPFNRSNSCPAHLEYLRRTSV